jgi:hypothetical protein
VPRRILLVVCLSSAAAAAAWPSPLADVAAVAARREPPPEAHAGPMLRGIPAVRRGARPTSEEAGATDPGTDGAPEGGVVDAVVEEIVDEAPDPFEEGPCRLTLHLVSAQDGTPAAPSIALWRLGAPGNAYWTWGDQRHPDASRADPAPTFSRLPPGRYRVQTLGGRRGTDDPAPFEVEDPDTHVRLEVLMPRRHRAHLRLLDERGRPLRDAHVQAAGSSDHGCERVPTWARARVRRGADPELVDGDVYWHSCGCGGGGSPTPVTTDEVGFPLGEFSEPAQGVSESRTFRVGRPGCSDVWIGVDSEAGAAADRVYLGVSVPLATLAEGVLLPDGRSAMEAGAHVRATCHAALLGPQPTHDAWRDLRILLHVRLTGYENLELELRAGDGPPRVTLRPAPTPPR